MKITRNRRFKATLASRVIDRLGGTTETARLCEIKPASVSEWRRKGIPQARLQYLQLLRPDVFQTNQ